MSDLQTQLTARRMALEQEREAFVQQANQRVGELNGRIAEISHLLMVLSPADAGSKSNETHDTVQ